MKNNENLEESQHNQKKLVRQRITQKPQVLPKTLERKHSKKPIKRTQRKNQPNLFLANLNHMVLHFIQTLSSCSGL